MKKPLSVAIIGGGISGLSCARRLTDLGVPCTVFDTGKRAVGGRSSSRRFKDGVVVDHACQCFTVESETFRGEVERWLQEGVVKVVVVLALRKSKPLLMSLTQISLFRNGILGKSGAWNEVVLTNSAPDPFEPLTLTPKPNSEPIEVVFSPPTRSSGTSVSTAWPRSLLILPEDSTSEVMSGSPT